MPDRRRRRAGLTYIEARDLALRYHAKLPVWPEDDEHIDDWVDLIAQLPAAEQQGRLTRRRSERPGTRMEKSAFAEKSGREMLGFEPSVEDP